MKHQLSAFNSQPSAYSQRGIGLIGAIAILVMLSMLAAAIVSVGTTQQTTSAQDVMSARAWQAARAGNEWGLYQALQATGIWYQGAASDPCPAGGALGHGAQTSQTLDLRADTGFRVTVTGDCWRYNEGESVPGMPQTISIYQIKSVACSAATCPASDPSVASSGYIERSRVVLATDK